MIASSAFLFNVHIAMSHVCYTAEGQEKLKKALERPLFLQNAEKVPTVAFGGPSQEDLYQQAMQEAEAILAPIRPEGERVYCFEHNGISIQVFSQADGYKRVTCSYASDDRSEGFRVIVCNAGIAVGRIPKMDPERAIYHQNRVKLLHWFEAGTVISLKDNEPVVLEAPPVPELTPGSSLCDRLVHQYLNKWFFVPTPDEEYAETLEQLFQGLNGLKLESKQADLSALSEAVDTTEPEDQPEEEMAAGNVSTEVKMVHGPSGCPLPIEEQLKLDDEDATRRLHEEEAAFWGFSHEELPDIKEYLAKANLSPLPSSSVTMRANEFAGIVRRILNEAITKLIGRIESYYVDPDKPLTPKEKRDFRELVLYIMGGLNCQSAETSAVSYKGGHEETPTGVLNIRRKIQLDAFKSLYEEFTRDLRNSKELSPLFQKVCGYIIAAVDGTDLNLHRNPYDEETHCSSGKGRKPYNQIHLNCIYDCLNGVYLAAQYSGRKKTGCGERNALYDMLSSMEPEDLKKIIITADRGYESHEALAHLVQSGCKFIVRVKDTCSNGILRTFPNIDAYGDTFQVWMKYYLYKQPVSETAPFGLVRRYDCLSEEEPLEIKIRIFQFRLPSGQLEALVTNIPSWEMSPYHLYCLYGTRWNIESSYFMLKYQTSARQIHSIKAEYVRQELWGKLLMFNFASFIMRHTTIPETKRSKPRIYDYAIKRSRGIVLCRRLLVGNIGLEEFGSMLVKRLQPIRPGRSFPREVKSQSVQSSQTMGIGM